MRVFNLTDVPTKVLEQRGLTQQHIAVARRMVDPGEFIEVADSATTRDGLAYLLQVGAVSIDTLPPAYLRARQAQQARQVENLRTSVPVSLPHVELQETVVAPAAGPALAVGDVVELAKHDPLSVVVDAVDTSTHKAGKGKRR